MFRFLFLLIVSLFSIASAQSWWNNSWQYRCEITVIAGDRPLHNRVIEIPMDFNELFLSQGSDKFLQEKSIRVMETDQAGKNWKECPVQYDPNLLLILLPGDTQPNTKRYFQVYFNGTDQPVPASPVDSLVRRNNLPGFYQFTTPGGFYVFDQQGGSFKVFAPVACQDNEASKDWIRDDYDRNSGIINISDAKGKAIFQANQNEDVDDSLSKGARSQIIFAGPLRYRVHAINRFGELANDERSKSVYHLSYDIFPYGVRAILRKNNQLGLSCRLQVTPGGDGIESDDFVTLDDGKKISKNLDTDLSSEWLYAGDKKDKNKLFFVHGKNDSVTDHIALLHTGQTMQAQWGPSLQAMPDTFYFGFTNQAGHENIKKYALSMSAPVSASIGKVEARSGAAPAKHAVAQGELQGDQASQTIANSQLEVTFGPDKFPESLRVRGISRFVYTPSGQNFARTLDAHGCGYAQYQHVDGAQTYAISRPNPQSIEAHITMQGCVNIDKSYRLYKDLPVLEITYHKLNLVWWQDFYAKTVSDTERVYTIFGIDHDITSARQAQYRKQAEDECGHNFGDCFLKAAGSSVEQSTYRGYLIFGFHDAQGKGLGFVTPAKINLHGGFKLWHMNSYEAFPFAGEKEKPVPLKRWIFIVNNGREEILQQGRAIADLDADGKSLAEIKSIKK